VTFTLRHARTAARAYAVVTALVGLGILAGLAVLLSAFGTSGATPSFYAMTLLPACLLLILSVFAWRQNTAAMIAGVLFAVGLRYVFGSPNPSIGVLLIVLPVVLAILTGICLLAETEKKSAAGL
jgi:hypothetical protein